MTRYSFNAQKKSAVWLILVIQLFVVTRICVKRITQVETGTSGEKG